MGEPLKQLYASVENTPKIRLFCLANHIGLLFGVLILTNRTAVNLFLLRVLYVNGRKVNPSDKPCLQAWFPEIQDIFDVFSGFQFATL